MNAPRSLFDHGTPRETAAVSRNTGKRHTGPKRIGRAGARAGKLGLAGLATSALVLGMAIPAAQAAPAAAPDDAIADFTFDEPATSGNYTSGDVVATVKGTESLAASADGNGTAANLGTGFWLDLKKSNGDAVLAGEDAVTISYDAKPATGNQGWTVFAPREAGAPTHKSEHYLGVIDTEAEIKVERFNNSGARPEAGTDPSSTATRTGWRHVDLVLDGEKAALYVDGVRVSAKTTGAKLTDILGSSGGLLQIGKANWGSGEYYTGLLDNLRITPRALTVEELSPGDTELAQQDLDAISIENADDMRGSFSVPARGPKGSNIAWKITGGDANASLKDGVSDASRTVRVDRPAAGASAATIELSATVTNGDASVTKTFTVKVQPKPAAAGDPEGYVWAFFTGEDAGAEKISIAASDGNNAALHERGCSRLSASVLG